MDVDELRQLLKRPEPEGLKLDFKRKLYVIDHPDPRVRDMHWDELIKDVLALANGNVGTARQPGYLIIGVADELNEHGSRDLCDVGDVTLSAQRVLNRVNAACRPPLPSLHTEVLTLQGKRILIIMIPPTPYLHETIRPLKTSKGVYQENTVFVRRAENIGLASTDERQTILADKQSLLPVTVPSNGLDTEEPGFAPDLIQEHRKRLAANPRYARWADKSPDESYIHATGMHLPLFASPYEDIGGPSKELQHCIRSYDRLLVLGEPGTGKTVALERAVWEFCTSDSSVVPILIPLIQYDGNLMKDIIVATGETEILNVTSVAAIKRLVCDHRCVFLFDGLNEVAGSHREKLYAELASWLRTHPSCPCVITSRSQDELWRRFHCRELIEDALVVRRITDAQIIEYLIGHLGEQRGKELYDRLNEPLRGLARIPLLLWLIKEAGRTGEELPGNRGELFDRFVRQVLKREQKQPDLATIRPDQKMQMLSYLAFYLHQLRRLACSRDEAIQMIEESQKGVNGSRLIDESLRNGLLIGENKVHFMHHAVHEYFAACRLQDYISSLQASGKRVTTPLNRQIRKWAREDWWAEVIVQLAGIAEQPELVVEQVLRSNPWLAYWCSIEGQPLSATMQSRIERRTVARLGSRKASERLSVIHALARIENPRTIKYLVVALSDDDNAVQELASRTLDQLGEPSVSPLLDSLTSATERGRWAAIRILGAIWGFSKIADLGSEDSDVRDRAAEALGNTGDDRAVLPLAATLEDSNEAVRNQAVQSLGKLGDGRAIAPLERARTRTYNRVRPDECARVLRLLKHIDRPSDEPLLTGIRDSDYAVRQRALVALGRAWRLPAIAELANDDPAIRIEGTRKLGQLPDPRVAEPLLSALQDEEQSVRRETIRALGNLWDSPGLIALGNEDTQIRRDAFRGTQTLREARVIEPLIATLKDQDREVREGAAKALAALGEIAIGRVAPLLNSEDREIRQMAGKILAEIGGARVVRILFHAIQDHRSWIRQTAADSLARLGEQAIPALEVALQNDDPEIRRLVRVTLRRIKTIEAQGILRFESIISTKRERQDNDHQDTSHHQGADADRAGEC